jgi:hypothetical protein
MAVEVGFELPFWPSLAVCRGPVVSLSMLLTVDSQLSHPV